jgi:hypothetical protein
MIILVKNEKVKKSAMTGFMTKVVRLKFLKRTLAA